MGALIIWSVIRYRKRSPTRSPASSSTTSASRSPTSSIPIIIVLILFGFTVFTENQVDAVTPTPAVKVHVTAFQWGWQLPVPGQGVTSTGRDHEDPDPVGLERRRRAPRPWTASGPGLVVPAGQTTRITLNSQDVIHGFYVPQFNFSRYAQPGVTNVFDLTVEHPGIYRAQCTQLCGLYHSLMFFHVVALPPGPVPGVAELRSSSLAGVGRRTVASSRPHSTTKAAA